MNLCIEAVSYSRVNSEMEVGDNALFRSIKPLKRKRKRKEKRGEEEKEEIKGEERKGKRKGRKFK